MFFKEDSNNFVLVILYQNQNRVGFFSVVIFKANFKQE